MQKSFSIITSKFYICTSLLICLVLNFIVGCKKVDTQNIGNGKVNELKYTSRLKMWTNEEGVRFAEVFQTNDTTKPLATYIFPLKKDLSAYQKEYPNAIIIPKEGLNNLLVYSSVFSTALDEMGVSSLIGSVVDAQYFSNPRIIEGLQNGTIKDIGMSQNPSEEVLIASKPNLALVGVYDGMDFSILNKHSIPVVYMADNLENNPLGRAEWIKFLSTIVGQPEKGDIIFNAVEKKYNSLKNIGTTSSHKPKIMVENMYQGIWYVPGGASYAAQLMKDAGGDYIWKDNNDFGSLSLSFENVLSKASDADIWLLKLYGTELTKEGLKEMDERNMLFGPVKKGNVWYSNTKHSNIFDETAYHPELLLREYIKIFHPEKDTTFTPQYFKRMSD